MDTALAAPTLPAIRVKRVLYATDFSDASRTVLPVVSAIARKYGSQIFIANICSFVPYTMGSPQTVAAMDDKLRSEAQAKAEELSQAAELAGIQTAVIVQPGDVVDEIDRVVHEQNIDLVVLGTHGRTGWKHLVMGSVAEELFRRLSCPVVTIGPRFSRSSEKDQVKRILFPTDLSQESRIVSPYFASLAAENEAELILLHILPEETGTNPDARTLAEPLRKEMETIFSPQISPQSHAEFLIEFGDPAVSILLLAQRRNVDLIAMGVRQGAEFLTAHFRNTVAYRVALGAECPVLTWRPAKKWFDWFMEQWQTTTSK
jgi:nucleotide-binding universal stress UspA family protein